MDMDLILFLLLLLCVYACVCMHFGGEKCVSVHVCHRVCEHVQQMELDTLNWFGVTQN